MLNNTQLELLHQKLIQITKSTPISVVDSQNISIGGRTIRFSNGETRQQLISKPTITR